MAWNSLTNQRAVQTTTRLVVALCHQMEDWRRLLRHIERIRRGRDAASLDSATPSGGEALAGQLACQWSPPQTAPPEVSNLQGSQQDSRRWS